MKKFIIIIFTLIFILATFLRFYKFENRVPFDWDQNRDYGEVIKIASGESVFLGPVAKGVGGFYLGSLYYYFLYPAYYITNGSLSALPITSILFDLLVVVVLYLTLRKKTGESLAIIAASVWATSWFIIETSRISWNVALIPLWSILTIYSISKVIENKSKQHFYILALLAGLTVHIHVTTIPIIPIVILLFWKKFSFSIWDWIKAILLGFVPAIPLIVYDLNHSFLNLHLVRDFITFHNKVSTPLISMIPISLTKLGKVVSGIFISYFRDNIILGFVVFICSTWSVFSKNSIVKISALFVIINTILIILFRDYGFPEYYFSASYIAICIITISTISSILNRFGSLGKPVFYLCVLLVIVFNLYSFTSTPTGFSLAVKNQIVESLKAFKEPINVHYSFDPGRDGGLRYLVKQNGINQDPKARNRVLLSDKLNTPLYIDGELTRDIIQIGNIRSALYVVQ